MAIELLVLVDDDSTEDEIQLFADIVVRAPIVLAVLQKEESRHFDKRITHAAPVRMQ